jgi:hypothetical protein
MTTQEEARRWVANHETPVEPDDEDFAEVDRDYGELPIEASDNKLADHYRLVQAAKLIRMTRIASIALPMDGSSTIN